MCVVVASFCGSVYVSTPGFTFLRFSSFLAFFVACARTFSARTTTHPLLPFLASLFLGNVATRDACAAFQLQDVVCFRVPSVRPRFRQPPAPPPVATSRPFPSSSASCLPRSPWPWRTWDVPRIPRPSASAPSSHVGATTTTSLLPPGVWREGSRHTPPKERRRAEEGKRCIWEGRVHLRGRAREPPPRSREEHRGSTIDIDEKGKDRDGGREKKHPERSTDVRLHPWTTWIQRHTRDVRTLQRTRRSDGIRNPRRARNLAISEQKPWLRGERSSMVRQRFNVHTPLEETAVEPNNLSLFTRMQDPLFVEGTIKTGPSESLDCDGKPLQARRLHAKRAQVASRFPKNVVSGNVISHASRGTSMATPRACVPRSPCILTSMCLTPRRREAQVRICL